MTREEAIAYARRVLRDEECKLMEESLYRMLSKYVDIWTSNIDYWYGRNRAMEVTAIARDALDMLR